MSSDNKYVIIIPEPQRWFLLSRVKSQFLRMLHEGVANDGLQRASHSRATFLLEERIVHLKIVIVVLRQSSSSSMTASTCKTDRSAYVLSL
jgi:hypothetical protein